MAHGIAEMAYGVWHVAGGRWHILGEVIMYIDIVV